MQQKQATTPASPVNAMKGHGSQCRTDGKQSMSPKLVATYARMADSKKRGYPNLAQPAERLVLPASAYADEEKRYHDKARKQGGVVFMGD